MAAKYQLMTELYRRTGIAVAKNPQAWQSFLAAACRNYKCRFDEQLLIYAQRPDAIAVAELDTWNKRFKRWVNKDSKGIAVFDPKGRRNTLKYYFDVSDTHDGYYGSRPVPIWQMNGRYEQAVIERISDRFGNTESTDLASALTETAKNAVEDNLQDYFSQLKDFTQDSFLEELDDLNVDVCYRRLVTNSVAFMLMSRCGLDTNEHFDREDFEDIINFNTPATINALGIATSDISEMALKEISLAIQNLQIAEKDANRTFVPESKSQYNKGRTQPERSENNERNHLQQAGRLSYSRPDITDRARNSAWQIRTDAQELSGAAQASDLSQPADIGQAERASVSDRADGSPEIGASDEAAFSRTGRDGGTERESPDAVGTENEQHPQSSGGSDYDRADLQVSVANADEVKVNLPPVEEQIEMIAEAEDEKSSAFAVSQEDIDSVLTRGSGFQDGKYRIYRQFQKYEDSKSNIAFLKKEYGIGGGTHYYPDGTKGGDVSLRDITFQNSTGFPINRVEKIGYIRSLLEQAEAELPSEEKTDAPAALSADRHNFRITDDTLGVGGAKEKFRNNMTAINLLHELEIENRLATPEEQEILSRYVGWGGLSMAFDEHNAAWADEFKELYATLSPEEYNAAMESTLTAFYTPPVVIKAMYEALDHFGFSQGNILEPSCGTGNFFGLLPESMAGSKLHGVELDPLTGKIAKQLYQKANIAIEGFEQTKLPDDHFDVVIGNVPFGEIRVNDSRYNAQKFLIHDYFFAKALDKVRAGGVVMFITSKGTMDKASPEVRKYIAQRAELLGAIRLPNNTFRANAGTEVTSDILILQKRDRVIDVEPDWVYLDTDENGVTMNSYFVQHPEMVLGQMRLESTRFGKSEPACKAYEDKSLSELLHNAVQRINGEITEFDNEIDQISDEQDTSIPADPNVRNFSFALVDGKVYFRENDRMTPATVSMTAENRIKGLIEIRDCVRRLIEYQTEDYPEEMIRTEQENLNRLYDSYTEKYGLINSRGNYLAFASDESYFLLCSLEVLDDEGNFKRKADMFTKRTIKPHREVTSVETSSEALALSIGEKARVDLPYMEQLTGKTQDELVKDLHGVIFKVPNSEPVSYAAADEYLSGNVRTKLIIAQAAAKDDPELAVNVEALKQVIPKDLSAAEISVRLGTIWIPQEDIQQFVMELLTPSQYARGKIKVRYTEFNGDWFIENKSSDFDNVKANSTYGTKRASAYRIIEDTLNLRDVRIFDYVYDEHGNKKAVFNAKETTAAQAKQEAIKQAFADWIWKDPKRRNRLVRYYNDTFNCIRPREYDGSHITFGGISPEITLRPHQVNAIAHILYGGNTLLAHKVGAGKTFEMVAAAQESKRLGLCQKSMFVVPNHLVGQWASEYLRLYPSANILVTTKQDFETGNRKKFCGRIATGDYDAVIIGHSQFEKIPMSVERQKMQLEKQLFDIERGIKDVQASKGEQFTVKQLMKTRKGIKAKLDKLNDTKRKDTVIDFEQFGVDRLFIDESHFYKNLYLYTKMRRVGGIAQTEAQKSSDLFMKCRYLDEITGNRGTIFATGTPVSNSMVELYSVQRYLQYDTLVRNGLQHFDSWASTFGETITALELAPEGSSYRPKTRFAKFHNLPELMQMFREVADIQTADMLKLPVPKVNYRNIKVAPSEIQTEMVASLAKRAEKVRDRLVEPYIDNMLKITNDGRKLALDQRLIDPMLPDFENSKVNACVDNVYRIWAENADTRATQLVFCDLSTPKNDGTFNVYDDIRAKLTVRGIPAEQIRFMHEATTDAQKKELFAKVRSGEVRVLLGSTPKMGAGTNVQDRLKAIHNLDCPWRPSDVGRILRTFKIKKNVEVTDNGKIII